MLKLLLTLPMLAVMLFQEADLATCTNVGGRAKANTSTTCNCAMPCDPSNPHGFETLHNGKCKTYCKQDHCHCKPLDCL